jgi:hypothetical protein
VDDDVQDLLHGFQFFLHNGQELVTHTTLSFARNCFCSAESKRA